MKITNQVLPTDPNQIKDMMADGPDGPIYMVNLLKFKDKAEYEDGRETDLSGRDAYNIYGGKVAKIIEKFGGKIFFGGDVTFLALGQVEDENDMWDEVAIAVYPKRRDLLNMSMSEEWQAASVHRTAGLKGQINIETVAQPAFHTKYMDMLTADLAGGD